MRNGRDPPPLQPPPQHLFFERLPVAHGEHEPAVAVAERPRRVEDLHRAAAERSPVLPVRLHPGRRDGPHVGRGVHLGPSCPTDLAPSCGRENEELEGQLDGVGQVRRPHVTDVPTI